ncbi:hypothetical protein Ssi03_41450 [Sphaerisporangium siamense]|uniref:Uncharacterized protein n=1 Tax=Sphaerisporangium siamense TaxID=795645 RepID=A0A7W7GAZ4_9ACTN|nr:hypothetical protein [Sphaerisporangium siamense]MBB4704543.1 hypothetical protein [Sphaerisporangium siamense]GII86155.1 hypothetical protein Ssi03_41450 [Sphaerisporangium siamense]
MPRHDWSETLDALRAGSAPALASVAANPLGLWLIRMVYVVPNADPGPLLHDFRDGGTLRRHLLDHLIDALLAARPPVPGQAHGGRHPGEVGPELVSEPFRPRRAWNAGQVRLWLSHLATLLTRNGTRDLAWWDVARYATTTGRRWLLCVVGGLVAGVMAGVAAGVLVAVTLNFPSEYSYALIWTGIVFGLVVSAVIVFKARGWFAEVPGSADLRLMLALTFSRAYLTRRHLRQFAIFFLVMPILLGVVTLVAISLVVFFAEPRLVGVLGFLLLMTCAIVDGVIVFAVHVKWVEHPTPLTSATTASSTWRADRNLTVARIVAAGRMLALLAVIAVFAFGFIARASFTHVWPVALQWGVFTALIGGVACGIISGCHHGWLVCKATLVTEPSSRLPKKLIPFLEDMHRVGLLRAVGPIYQFRHGEVQDYLAEATARDDLKSCTSTTSGRGYGL